MTADLRLTCNAVGSWHVVHTRSGTALDTDLPPESGDTGGSFSATDLLAAALGVCIGTNIDAVAARHGVPTERLEIRVRKTLTKKPKRLAALEVCIFGSADLPAYLRVRLERAASHCLVHRSLHPDIGVSVTFVGCLKICEKAGD